MGTELVLLTSLGGILIATNVFWAIVCHKLVNKVMSRDFTEFRTAELKKPMDKRPEKKQLQLPDDMGPLQTFGM